MTADEIRKERDKNVETLSDVGLGSSDAIALMQYGATIELAAQVAELNDNLRLVMGYKDDPDSCYIRTGKTENGL